MSQNWSDYYIKGWWNIFLFVKQKEKNSFWYILPRVCNRWFPLMNPLKWPKSFWLTKDKVKNFCFISKIKVRRKTMYSFIKKFVSDQSSGCDQVEFCKVDKHFWSAFLGRNWKSSFEWTENDFGLNFNIINVQCWHKTQVIFCWHKAHCSMST